MSRAMRTELESKTEARPDAVEAARRTVPHYERIALRVGLYWALLNGLGSAFLSPTPDERLRGLLIGAVAMAGLACSIRVRD